MLKEKWWKQRKGGGKCKVKQLKNSVKLGKTINVVIQDAEQSGAAALGLANVGGVFVVLIGGLVMAAFIALCENLWSRRQQKRAQAMVS